MNVLFFLGSIFQRFFRFPKLPKLRNLRLLKLDIHRLFMDGIPCCTSFLMASPMLQRIVLKVTLINLELVSFIVLTFYYLHLHLRCIFYYLSVHMCYVVTYLLCYQVSIVDKSHVMFYCCLNCLSNSFCHLLEQPLRCHFYYVFFCCL